MILLPPVEEDVFQAVAGFLDAGVRATGIAKVRDAVKVLEWLESAKEAVPVEASVD